MQEWLVISSHLFFYHHQLLSQQIGSTQEFNTVEHNRYHINLDLTQHGSAHRTAKDSIM